jgi:hypothetical protein
LDNCLRLARTLAAGTRDPAKAAACGPHLAILADQLAQHERWVRAALLPAPAAPLGVPAAPAAGLPPPPPPAHGAAQ